MYNLWLVDATRLYTLKKRLSHVKCFTVYTIGTKKNREFRVFLLPFDFSLL